MVMGCLGWRAFVRYIIGQKAYLLPEAWLHKLAPKKGALGIQPQLLLVTGFALLPMLVTAPGAGGLGSMAPVQLPSRYARGKVKVYLE